MNIVTLKAFRATDIEFINHHDSGVRIEFENTYSYNVKYTPDNNCIGEFTLEVKDKSAPDKFRIKAVIVGSFGYDPSVKKEKDTYRELQGAFPVCEGDGVVAYRQCGSAPGDDTELRYRVSKHI